MLMAEFANPFSGITPDRKLSKSELLRALRLSLCAEEEAIHIYTAIADSCDDVLARKVLIDVANEERVHKGEFQRLIELLAPDETGFMKDGAKEVDELVQEPVKSSNDNKVTGVHTVGNLK
jgi:rubrerythrin